MKKLLFVVLFLIMTSGVYAGDFLGNFNNNQYDPDSVSNPYGRYGSKYSPDSINNQYGQYGSPYSNKSVNNPFATQAPTIYDNMGNKRGTVTINPYQFNVIHPYDRNEPYQGLKLYGE